MSTRRSLSIVAASAAGVLGAALLPGIAAQAAVVPAAGIPIKLGHSNKCFNVQSNSTANSAKIVQYGCSATAANDKFKLVPRGDDTYQIQSVSSGKCLNVTGNSIADNALIIQYTCSNAANNLWWVDEVPGRPTHRIISTRSGKCLNMPGNSTADNVQLVQYTCTSSRTKLNEQVYFPPTDSATPVARPLTTKQPISATQDGAGPVHLSWIGTDHQLNLLTDFDLEGSNPNAPDPVWLVTTGDTAYTGRTQVERLADGRIQALVHDGDAGDVALVDEIPGDPGQFGNLYDIGGSLAVGPDLARSGANGSLATFAIRNGALWYAPQSVNNPQAPVGAWRSLGGSGLTGTPAVVTTATGYQVFVINTAGRVVTAVFANGQLSDWVTLNGANLTGSLTAVTDADGWTTLFGRNISGAIGYSQQDSSDGGAWSGWVGLPADVPTAGLPSAVHNPETGALDVTYRGTDGIVYYVAETGNNTGEFGESLQVSDPEFPETLAASDPTAFTFTGAGGTRPAIAFASAGDSELPMLFTIENAAAAGQRKAATPEAERQKLDTPKQPAKLGS